MPVPAALPPWRPRAELTSTTAGLTRAAMAAVLSEPAAGAGAAGAAGRAGAAAGAGTGLAAGAGAVGVAGAVGGGLAFARGIEGGGTGRWRAGVATWAATVRASTRKAKKRATTMATVPPRDRPGTGACHPSAPGGNQDPEPAARSGRSRGGGVQRSGAPTEAPAPGPPTGI